MGECASRAAISPGRPSRPWSPAVQRASAAAVVRTSWRTTSFRDATVAWTSLRTSNPSAGAAIRPSSWKPWSERSSSGSDRSGPTDRVALGGARCCAARTRSYAVLGGGFGGLRLAGERLELVAWQLARDDLGDPVVSHADAVEDVRGVHRPLLVGDDDELRALREAAHEAEEAVDVDVVEGGLDLVQDVEGARPRHQHGEDEGQRDQRLLAAGEQRQPARRLARGRHLDLDTAVLGGRGELPDLVVPLIVFGLLPREGTRRAADVHPAQPAAAPREELGHHLLEAAGRRLEGLLEGRSDLPVGAADQRAQLGDRLLQVLALLGELGDVLARLLVLPLRQRIDRADLLAVALQPRQPRLDRLALLVSKRGIRRAQLLAERLPQASELGGALVALAAQLCGLDLGDRHRLARLTQLALQPKLLLGALAELRSDVGAVPVLGLGEGRCVRLEPPSKQEQRLADTAERRQRLLLE